MRYEAAGDNLNRSIGGTPTSASYNESKGQIPFYRREAEKALGPGKGNYCVKLEKKVKLPNPIMPLESAREIAVPGRRKQTSQRKSAERSQRRQKTGTVVVRKK